MPGHSSWVPMSEWKVLIQGRVPGYIPWERYLANLERLRQNVAELVPRLADRVTALDDWRQVSLLSVESDRMPRWYRPGLLLIGDAGEIHDVLMSIVGVDRAAGYPSSPA